MLVGLTGYDPTSSVSPTQQTEVPPSDTRDVVGVFPDIHSLGHKDGK